MRVKKEYRTASRENYKSFCEDHPDITLSYLEWSNIIYSLNYAFRDYMLETGKRAKMPFGGGEFMVSKKKKKTYKIDPEGNERINLSIDWKKTRQEGKHIYHTNRHTEGYNFYWRWEPRTARFYQSAIWHFKPARVTSRLITHYVSQPGYQHLYQQWDKTR